MTGVEIWETEDRQEVEGLRFSKVFKEEIVNWRGSSCFVQGGEDVESEIESIGLLIAVTWLPCGSWWILARRAKQGSRRSKKEEEEEELGKNEIDVEVIEKARFF